MKLFLKLVSCLLILTTLLSLIGCSNTNEAYIYFELTETPTTLDPQTASTDAELLIIKNIFEGLLRKNQKGEIVPAIAESYEKKGLTYTFKIRSDAKWSNGEKITAYDFQFGFKRAISPETEAAYASRLFSIKNAEKIHNGNTNLKSLGVYAEDNHTLKIELINEDPYFLETLTTSIAMPCNEEFFLESEGKYGLFTDNILSCGSYVLSRWRKETFGIRLYRNKTYNGFAKAKNAAVFITCDKDKTVFEKFQKESIDIAFIPCAKKSEADSLSLETLNIENICWVLTLSNQFSPNMRKAFSMLVGSEVFSKDLQSGYSVATSIYPSSVAKNISPIGLTPYNPTIAKSLYLDELAKLKQNKFPNDVYLYYFDDGNIKNIVTDIVGHWQSNFSAFVNIKPIDDISEFDGELKDQNLSMSIFPIKADSPNIREYLSNFGYSYNSEDLSEAQTDILKSNNIIPIMFQNTTIAYRSCLSNITAETGNGYLDFSFIIKDE